MLIVLFENEISASVTPAAHSFLRQSFYATAFYPRPKKSSLAPATAPATVIRSVRTSVMGGVLRIYIDTDGAAVFNAFTLAGPSRIVVDVRGVSNPSGNKIIPIDSRFVERVRVGQPDPATVRVVLDLTGQVPYEVIREGSSIVIVVGERGPTAKTGSR